MSMVKTNNLDLIPRALRYVTRLRNGMLDIIAQRCIWKKMFNIFIKEVKFKM